MDIHSIKPFYRLFRTVRTLDSHSMIDDIPDSCSNNQAGNERDKTALNQCLTRCNINGDKRNT